MAPVIEGTQNRTSKQLSQLNSLRDCVAGLYVPYTPQPADTHGMQIKKRGRPFSTSLAKGYLLFPLDGSSSDVPSFQLHPVFGAVSNRVPPGNAMSRFVGFGDKSRDNFKYFFRTQGFEFLFLSQRVQRADFGGSIAPKAPVLKLNRPLTRKPPAAIVSESARVVCAPFAKPQVATLRHSWEK